MNIFRKVKVLWLFTMLFFSCGSDDESPEIQVESLPTIVMTKVEVMDGTIFINWNPPSNQNFTKAELLVEGGSGFSGFQLSKETIIKGSYNDALSVNTKLTYSIKLENEDASTISNKITLKTEDIIIEEEMIGYNQLKVIYSRHPIYNNFNYYDYEINPIHMENLSPEGGEVVVDKEIVFGDRQNLMRYEHWLRPMNMDDEIVGDQIRKSFEIGNLFDTKDCSEYLYIPSKGVFLGLGVYSRTNATRPYDVFIYELNKENLSLVKSIQLPTEIDSASDIIMDLESGNILLDSGSKTYMLDVNDYSIISTWDSAEYSSNTVYETKYRGGLIILRTNQIEIYNANSKDLIFSDIFYNYFNISDNGRYFYNNDGLYKTTTGSVEFIISTEVSQSPYYVSSVDFMENEEKCVYTAPYHHPVIFDFKTKSKEVIKSLYDIDFVYWDDITNKITLGEYHVFNGQYSDQSFVTVYNPATKSSLKLHVYDDHYDRFYKYIFGVFLYSGGQYLNGYF